MTLTRFALISFFLISLCYIFVFLSFQSIRLDESQTIRIASKPITTVWKFIAQDIHVPLYFTILHFWMQVFGNSVISARIPSLIFYLLTLFVIYKFAREASDKKTAYLSILLFSFSPFILWYSFEARMYTQFAFFSSLSTLFFLRMVRTRAKSGRIGFLISTVFGVYTHYFYLFFLLSQGIYLIFNLYVNKVFLRDLKVLIVFLGLSFFSLLTLLPWGYYVYHTGQIANYDPLIPVPGSFNIFQTFTFFLFGFQDPAIQGVLVALWPMVIVLLFFVFTRRKKFNTQNLGYFETVTFVPVLLFFLVSFIRPIFLARYLIFTVPTLFFLLANVLLVFSKKLNIFLISLTFIIIFGFLIYQNISANTPVKENYEDTTRYLNQNVSPSDIIAVSAPFTVYPLEYSYTGAARLDTIPKWDRFKEGTFPPFDPLQLQKQIEEYKNIYSNLYVVLSYDQGYEKDIRSYLDNNYQLLEKREFSPGLELRKYKLRYP